VLLGAERDAGGEVPAVPRRLVVVADAAVLPPSGGPPDRVAATVGERPTGRSRVRLAGPVPWSSVVSLHVDEAEAAADVAAAVLALPAAARGEEEALYAVEDAEARDLLWYDVTEAPVLLAELTAPS